MKNYLFKNLFTLLLTFLSFQLFAGHLTGSLQFSARLNGASQVPALTTNALGVATFTLSENRDSICVNFSATGLSGAIGGMHIHEGASGTNGGVVVDLTSFISGNQASGIITGASLTAALIEKMLNGMLYLNVHTTANAGGEIRGQIKLETDHGYVASLNGAQENPAVTTNAFGLGTFNLSIHEGKLTIYVVVSGLSGVIGGAHLHTGAIGVDGGVVQDLTSGISGNVISITVDPTSYLADLKAGNIYINIHTAANAGGEIRGQVLLPDALYFDAMLNGAQENPAVVTSAVGVGSFMLSKTFDMLMYDVVVDGLSGAIGGAHLHTGAVGVDGGVALDLSSGIMGNRIMGTISGAGLTPQIIHDLLTGNIYLNVHTMANMGGEIRGQVYRLAREGYNIKMDGAQESPMVSTSAYGGGMVSIGRDQMDAHFMMVVGGLSGTIGGAHFHNGLAGVNGGVLFDLSSNFVNNGAFGYLKSTDTAPFNTSSSLLFRNNEVYVNIHTAANAGGEIRGQVQRGEICTSTLGQNEVALEKEFEIYPNPVSDVVTLNFKDASTKTIQILDVSGKKIKEITSNLEVVTFDLTNLTSGIYFVKIANSSSNKMIIKN